MERSAAGVLVGRDGWLYWIGRKGEVAALYADTPATRRLLRRWARRVARRAAQAEALGARYVQIVVPEKIAVHDEGLSEPWPDIVRPPCVRLAVLQPVYVLDLLAPLRAARDAGPVYLHTDTHWTHLGYRTAYRVLCEALAAPIAPTTLVGEIVPDRFTFDLGGKLSPPESETYEVYHFPRRAARVEANSLVRLRESGQALRTTGLFVGSRVVLRNPEAPDSRRLVLFGDSYTFDQGSRITAFLAESFAEVHAIWSADVDWTYVASVKPDLIVCETAERFLRRVPRDRIRIDALAERRVKRALRPTWRARLENWLR